MVESSETKSDDEKTKQELIAELEQLRAAVPASEDDVFAGKISAKVIDAALDATPALIAYVDSSMRYRYVNRAYTTWFGTPVDDIIGKPVKDFLDPGGYAAVKAAMERVMNGETVTHRNVLEVVDGQEKHVEAQNNKWRSKQQ